MINENDYFKNDGHISDIYIAICSDRLKEERVDLVPAKIRSHLENCELCRNSVLDIFSTTLSSEKITLTGSGLFSKHSFSGKPFHSSLFLRTAATFFILALITGIYIRTGNRTHKTVSPIKQITRTDHIIHEIKSSKRESNYNKIEKTATSQKIYKVPVPEPDPFKDNPNLEYMVDSHHRGRLIHIISPEFKILKKGVIVFKWENHIDKNLKLKILNNRNETLYIFNAEGSMVKFSGELDPGLYYWKLEDSDNLYHVGKFLIEK